MSTETEPKTLSTPCPSCDSYELAPTEAQGEGALDVTGKPVKYGDRINVCLSCGAITRPSAKKKAPAKRPARKRPARKRG